jgi:hypothetical protein
MRAFTLVRAGVQDGHRHDVPGRLLDMIDDVIARFADPSNDADARLEAAIERGDVVHDHRISVPVAAAPHLPAVGDMFDEADEHCWQGRHLLTLASTPD